MEKTPREALWEPLGNLAGAVRAAQPALHDDVIALRNRLTDDDIPASVHAADARALVRRAKCDGWIKNEVLNRAEDID